MELIELNMDVEKFIKYINRFKCVNVFGKN